jgi:translation elongation factor EF-Tu-like GTPase
MPPSPEHDIEAEIRFLTAGEGGGPGPYCSRLNTTHDFGLGNSLSDAMHFFQGKDQVSPGEAVLSRLSFLDPEAQNGRLYVGFTFTVQEATRVIGHGRITKVLNKDLQRQ